MADKHFLGMQKQVEDTRKALDLPCSQCGKAVHNGWHYGWHGKTDLGWRQTDDTPKCLNLDFPKYCEACMKKSVIYQVQNLPEPVNGYRVVGSANIYYEEWVERVIDIHITGKDALWFWQNPTEQAVVNAYNDMDIDEKNGYGVGVCDLMVSLL